MMRKMRGITVAKITKGRIIPSNGRNAPIPRAMCESLEREFQTVLINGIKSAEGTCKCGD